jgi:hypothetical protein
MSQVESPWSRLLTTIGIAVLTATIAYSINYFEQRRKDQVEFVSNQIERLYGPLFALTQANDIAWVHFVELYWPDPEFYFQKGKPSTPEQVELWRRWMGQVFQPMNEKMEATIVNNAQLLVGNQMPQSFLQLASHTESYKAVIVQWGNDHDSSKYLYDEGNVPHVSYPGKTFSQCVQEQFLALKTLQAQLRVKLIHFRSIDPIIPAMCRENTFRKRGSTS